jgi:4-amino-4-deoxy-L-arabinose transferase-like glycosyltransferase
LPLKIAKFASQAITLEEFQYNNIALVGRLISALFDIGVVFLVYKIGKKIFNKKTGLLASFLYSISVLPIQLSHFFAVDTFLVFFLTFSFYFLISLNQRKQSTNCHLELIKKSLLGISFGLALACKISALYFLPIIALGFLFHILKKENKLLIIGHLLLTILIGYLTFRLADPRAFANANLLNPPLNSQFVANLKQLQSFNNPKSLFPPGIQWIGTKPIIFPLKNMLLWGLGIPLGIFTISAVFYSSFAITKLLAKLYQKSRFKLVNHLTVQQFSYLLILFWTLLLFFYQATQFVKALRYFFPIYPFLSLITANFIYQISKSSKKKYAFLKVRWPYSFIIILLLIWPLSFMSIYSRPHSRVTASEWIYENIPAGSVVSCEHWDDCLPLPLPNKNSSIYEYKTETLALFDPDTPIKWRKINSQLKNIDYLIMSSNRLWGTIPKVPEKYPFTSKFYEDLLSEKLQFTKVAEITSYPTIPILNIKIPNDFADESFTSYDHPKILIYKKIIP